MTILFSGGGYCVGVTSTIPGSESALRGVRNLRRGFGSIQAVNDVSLSVHAGETY